MAFFTELALVISCWFGKVMFWFLFGISAYWFIFFKLQYRAYVLLPFVDDLTYGAFFRPFDVGLLI